MYTIQIALLPAVLPISKADDFSLPVLLSRRGFLDQEVVALRLSQMSCTILSEEGPAPAFCERGSPCYAGGCAVWNEQPRTEDVQEELFHIAGQQHFIELV